MDKYKKLASNTIIFAIGTFSSKILSFLLMPFVTRMLTTADYGSADLIQQTVNVLIPIVTLQVNSAALRFSLDKTKRKADVLTVGIRTTLLGFIVFLVFAYPISLITINDFKLGEYIELIYIFVLISGFRQLCQQFVRGSGKVKLYAVDGIIATATTLIFTFLFLSPLKMGVTGYIFAIIASDACSIIFYIFAAKLYKYVRPHLFEKGIAGQMLWSAYSNSYIVVDNKCVRPLYDNFLCGFGCKWSLHGGFKDTKLCNSIFTDIYRCMAAFGS